METIEQVLYVRISLEIDVGVRVAIAHQKLFDPQSAGGMRSSR